MRELGKTVKQKLAFLLTVAMILTSIQVPVFAAEITADTETAIAQTETEASNEESVVTEAAEEEDSAGQETAQETAVVEESVSSKTEEVSATDSIVEELTGADVTSPLEVPDGNTKYMKAVMNNKGQIKVSWKAMNKSKYYKVYRFVSDYDGQGTEGFQLIQDGKLNQDEEGFTTKRAFVDYDALGDSIQSFVYKVVAFDRDKKLVEPNTEKKIPNAVTAVCMPVTLNIESTSTTTQYDGVDNGKPAFDYTFEQIKGSHITYEIYRNDNKINTVSENDEACTVEPYNGKVVKSSLAMGVTYSDKSGDIAIGEKYGYQVRAVFTVGDKTVTSDLTKKKTVRAAIAKPYLLWVYNVSSNKIQIVFNRVEGADSYEIFYSTKENGTYRKMSTKMTGGKVTEAFAKAHPFEYPYYIDGEEIWRNDGWAAIDVEMKPETEFYYRVRAVKDKKAGDMSDFDCDMTHLDLVTDLFAANTSDSKTGIELSFTKIGGATQYRVQRKNVTSGGSFEDIAITKGKIHKNGLTEKVTIVDKKDLLGENIYVYQVIPRVGKVECIHNEQEPIPSNEVKCTQSGPQAEADAFSLRSVKARWKAISKATGYEIQYSSTYNAGDTENPLGANAKSVTVEKGTTEFSRRCCYVPTEPGKMVYLRVRAVTSSKGGTGQTSWSGVVGAQGKPKALTGFSATWDSDDRYRAILKWDRSPEYPEVNHYRVRYCTGSSSDYSHTLTSSTTAQKAYKSIEDGVVYNFCVAGVYLPNTTSEVVGRWTTCRISTPRYLRLSGDAAGGQTINKTKGWSGNVKVKYLNSNKDSFTPTEKKVNWYTNTSWITVSTGSDYSGSIKVNNNCPAGTYAVTARTFNYRNHQSDLTQTFYIRVQ